MFLMVSLLFLTVSFFLFLNVLININDDVLNASDEVLNVQDAVFGF